MEQIYDVIGGSVFLGAIAINILIIVLLVAWTFADITRALRGVK